MYAVSGRTLTVGGRLAVDSVESVQVDGWPPVSMNLSCGNNQYSIEKLSMFPSLFTYLAQSYIKIANNLVLLSQRTVKSDIYVKLLKSSYVKMSDYL